MKSNIAKYRHDVGKLYADLEYLHSTYGRLFAEVSQQFDWVGSAHRLWDERIEKEKEPVKVANLEEQLDSYLDELLKLHREIITLSSYIAVAISSFRLAATQGTAVIAKKLAGISNE